MDLKKLMSVGLFLGMGVSFTACSTNYMVDRALGQGINRATNRVGDEIGNKLGDALAAHMLSKIGPEMMRTYSLGLFQILFYQGGYSFQFSGYEPGQYTRWDAQGLAQGDWFEKALLKREEDGSEWWRVESRGTDEDGKPVELIIEALFGPEKDGGGRQILRMRAKYPHKDEAQEVPVREQDGETWAMNTSYALTKESAEGMKIGSETLKLPAGTFETAHLRTSSIATEDALNWWVTEQDVPGRVVQYSQEVVDEDGEGPHAESVYKVTLLKYGQDATVSKLGTF